MRELTMDEVDAVSGGASEKPQSFWDELRELFGSTLQQVQNLATSIVDVFDTDVTVTTRDGLQYSLDCNHGANPTYVGELDGVPIYQCS